MMEEVHGLHRGSRREGSFVRHALLAILTLAGLLTTVQTQFPLYYYVSLSFNGASRLGRYIVAATKVAEDDIVGQGLIPATYKLTRVLVDDHCSGVEAMRGTLTQTDASRADIAAVAFGGICNSVCRPLANYFGAFNILFISAGCRTDELSDTDRNVGYPYISRLVSPWVRLVTPFMTLMTKLKFPRLGLLAIESDQDWLQLQKLLKTAVEKNGTTYSSSRIRPVRLSSNEGITEKLVNSCMEALEAMKGKTMVIALLLNDREVLATLLAAKRLKMLKDYFYIAFGYTPDVTGKMWSDPDLAKEVQQGLVSMNTKTLEGTDWKKFEDSVRQAVPPVLADVRKSPANENITVEATAQLSSFAGLLYDSMMLWARALKDSGQIASATPPAPGKPPFSEEQMKTIFKQILKTKFKGTTGDISLNEKGDRQAALSVDIVQEGLYLPIFKYIGENDTQVLRDLNSLTWPGDRKKVPVGYPEPCGFDREYCPPGITDTLGFQIGMAIGSFLLLLIIIVLVWFFCFYRRAKQQAEINAINAWIVNCDEVLTNFEGKSIVDKKRVSSAVRRVTYGSMTNKEQTFSKVGYYKGTVVCIKHIERGSIDRLDPALFSELKQMRSIKHENANGFVGVCITAPNVCYLTVYCKNGSLQDIVQDEAFELGTEFKISFAMDVAQGMEHLHESVIGSHGRLNSSNCVIDNKWTCKITDYGMGNFRRKLQPPEITEKYFSNKLWTAPELLRMPDDQVPLYGTQKGDVYSYGIILQELAMRDSPYSKVEISMTYQDMVEMLKTKSEPPFRPKVPESACSAEWMHLMTRCWTEEPDSRPTFREVMKTAKLLSGGQAINIVDNMMKKLEKHNEKLEELVAERTAELNVEKKKVVALLYNILPKSVAESLMRQGRVTPEAFELVTLYFSDIVGFMKINQSSTAYQVVALLNAIYSVFDDVTDKYDVYKCETIGDVYMVASGLPVRNGDRHASEIATMALHLLSSVASFQIPHMPGKLLQLRIGLHTGPVVAGVVGQRMPHYCLFGDTVNTASRMQSGGLALRIHSSNTCADLLISSGEFQMDYRGEREVKGKGIMKTYWVLSKTGFDMPLPDLSRAASLEEHEFK